jgi:phosphatidylglycerol:prolipoprotein diacylglycerol transferase
MAIPLMIPWFKFHAIAGLQPFGMLVFFGLLIGFRTAMMRARRIGLNSELTAEFLMHAVAIGLIGSHIFDRFAYYPELVLKEPSDLLHPWRSLSSFGGFGFGLVGAFIWKLRRRMDITVFLDQLAFALPVAWIFCRTACFVVHDHPGAPSDWLLAVDDYQYYGLPTEPRHDLGLYEAMWAVLTTALFFKLDRRPRAQGFFVGLIGVLYIPFRFLLDFLRYADATYFELTPAQYLCPLALASSAYVIWRTVRCPSYDLPSLHGLGSTRSKSLPKA